MHYIQVLRRKRAYGILKYVTTSSRLHSDHVLEWNPTHSIITAWHDAAWVIKTQTLSLYPQHNDITEHVTNVAIERAATSPYWYTDIPDCLPYAVIIYIIARFYWCTSADCNIYYINCVVFLNINCLLLRFYAPLNLWICPALWALYMGVRVSS